MEFKLVSTICNNELESYLDEEFGEGNLELEEILADLDMYGETTIGDSDFMLKIEVVGYSDNQYNIYEKV
ncbi:MAG: hypothetical protein ACRC23_02045 [Aeromonas jandaei]